MSNVYKHTEEVHNMVAPREVVPIIMDLIKPKSILDVGSGTGTWLKAFEEAGIQDYRGLDGDYVDGSTLQISAEKFTATDLSKPWTLNRKYDLVVSLEVAEHLPESSADTFVKSLTLHGDAILFSAAIPGQGGQGHLNEQWPEYWQQKFSTYGFYFHDIIRPLIWDNEKVNWWYRQNIFLVDRNEENSTQALSKVHPELFKLNVNNELAYKESLTKGKQGLRTSTAIFFNALKFKLRSFLR